VTRKIVVAGGTGLIGSALVASLVERGDDVVVLSRSAAPARPGAPRHVRWDGRSVGEWARELEGAAAVVNLCGAGIADRRWTAARKRVLESSRVEPTRALVEAIATASARPRVLAQGSAVGFYGNRGDEAIDERSEPGSGYLSELSLEWEAASAGVEAAGVRRVLLRTGIVLARDGGALPVMARPFRFGVGGPLGDGGQWMPWIHLDDEIAAIRFLLDRSDASGPYNLAGPEPVTNATLSRELAKALHRPNLLRAPAFAMRLALGEMAEMVLGGQRVAPRRLLEAGFAFRFVALAPALADHLREPR
jgi:uncharacterized protein (TIGR01777 family)